MKSFRLLSAMAAVCGLAVLAARSQASERAASWFEQPLSAVAVQVEELGEGTMVLSSGPVSAAYSSHPLNQSVCDCAFTEAYALSAVADGLAIGHYVYQYGVRSDALRDAIAIRDRYAVAPATSLMASEDGSSWLVRVPDQDYEHPVSYFWFANVAGTKLSLLMVGIADAAFSANASAQAERQLTDPQQAQERRDQLEAASDGAISLLEKGNLARWYPWGTDAFRSFMESERNVGRRSPMMPITVPSA